MLEFEVMLITLSLRQDLSYCQFYTHARSDINRAEPRRILTLGWATYFRCYFLKIVFKNMHFN